MGYEKLPNVLTINYTKTNAFMREEGSPNIKSFNKSGEQVSTGDYVKNSAPQSQSFRRIPWSYKKREFLVNLDDDELNEIVEDVGLTYPEGHRKSGEIIKKANRKNRRDAFFKHKDLHLMFESGQTALHPNEPMHYLFYKSMEIDPRFKIAGDSPDRFRNAKVEYTISKSGDKDKRKVGKVKETMEATKLLSNMDFDKQKKVIRAMGVSVHDPDPEVLEATIYEKITDFKDQKISRGGARNIEAFMRFAKAENDDLSLLEIITESEDQGIMYRKSGNRYFYEDIKMGTSKESVVTFLKDPENEAIKREIIERTKL